MRAAPFVDPALAEAFRREGWLVVPGPGADVLERLRSQWDGVDALHEGRWVSSNYTLPTEDLRRGVFDGIREALRPFLDGLLQDYRFLSGGFSVKRPGAPAVVPHRHWAVGDEARHVVVSLWLPLDPVGPENGCLGVLPRTHERRTLTGHRAFDDSLAENYQLLPMEPGRVLLMDNRLVHGSLPNATPRPRRAVVALAAPRSAPRWCCHEEGGLVEVYEVPEDFYMRHLPGSRPTEGRLLVRLPASRHEV